MTDTEKAEMYREAFISALIHFAHLTRQAAEARATALEVVVVPAFRAQNVDSTQGGSDGFRRKEVPMADEWAKWARTQAERAEEHIIEARRLAQKKDPDVLAALLDHLDRAKIAVFEIHTGTGNA